MTFDQGAVKLLLALSTVLGVSSLPSKVDPTWTFSGDWKKLSNNSYLISARSKVAVSACKAFPESRINFPAVIQGAHEFYLDGNLIGSKGDPSFNSVESFFSSPSLSCKLVSQGVELEWRVFSSSRYFARILKYPEISQTQTHENFFSETLNLIAAGTLVVLAVVSLFIFQKRLPGSMTAALITANLGQSLYFSATVAGHLALPGSMLTIHKIGDTGVMIGFACYFYAILKSGFELHLSPWIFRVYLAFIAAGILIVLVGSTVDGVQLGTSLPFLPTTVLDVIVMCGLAKRIIMAKFDRRALFAIISITVFLLSGINEISIVTGVSDSFTVFSLGSMACLTFFLLTANENITHTYEERDYLRENLQNEVAIKTEQLRNKNSELSQTLTALEFAQADLIQKEKLASLGTLSAGIAHEINNSLNFVSGAIGPLRKISDSIVDESKKLKFAKLLGAMSEGLELTFEIIKSLKNYTALNKAKQDELLVSDLIKGVLILLSGRIRGTVEVVVEIPSDLKIYGSVVALNQVFMNLITNALDAMSDTGKLTIRANQMDERVMIDFTDIGAGIAPEIIGRIYDPFFTTKEVGKGTGIGLHIVKSELERHKGKITVESILGKGTTFRVEIPGILHEKSRGVA